LSALGQMQNGVLPPTTSLPENNPMWDMIDAQLTTEIFGALAPGRPDIALKIGHLPVRTTAYLHSEWAAEFYIIMYSLAASANQSVTRKEQLRLMAEKARKRIPEWSYIADMYDFVKSAYEANVDKDNWEKTRDEVARRYQYANTAGYQYKYPWDSGINFAASMISLFYGEGNYKKTIRIGSMCGWDSDNPTATWGGLLGFMIGQEGIEKTFDQKFSNRFNIHRTRQNFPNEGIDTFENMAEKGIFITDRVVQELMNGGVDLENNVWYIPQPDQGFIIESTKN